MNTSFILTNAFGTLFSAFWWFIPLLFLIAFLKSPLMKGIFGEWMVNLAAKFFLDKQIYRLFKNVTLRTENGTTQIDHIIVSRYGVFVIETKNMKGWIFGGQNQKTWTQKIYRHSSTFPNPLHQNYKHTQTLQSALGIEPNKIFSLVVFVGDSTFKTPMPENVVYAGGYIRFIQSKILPILSESEVTDICTKIESDRLTPSIKTHHQHVRHVRTIIAEKEARIDKNQCQKCGKPMVLRTARSGSNQGKQFWGCSGFPKCKTIRQLS